MIYVSKHSRSCETCFSYDHVVIYTVVTTFSVLLDVPCDWIFYDVMP